MTFCDSDGLSSNYCGNERRKTAYIHTYTVKDAILNVIFKPGVVKLIVTTD